MMTARHTMRGRCTRCLWAGLIWLDPIYLPNKDIDDAHKIAAENSNDHPEIRHVRTVNRIARKFRRPGVERDIEAVAIQNAVRSLERRGIDVGSDAGFIPTKTTEKFAPAVMPKTPNSLGISQDGRDFCKSRGGGCRDR
jgi:hypothetical protein